MIIVKNRELLIPNNERYIGTTYDTETENRIFQVPRYSQRGVDLAALTFRLDIQYANNSYDTVILDKEVDDEFVLLIWRITSATLQVPGTMYIGLRAIDGEATVKWSSFSAAMYVERHLNTPGNYSGSLTEIEQMEQDHQYMKGVVDELKGHIDYTFESEAWAVGKRNGEDVSSSDPAYHNNSKYYKEQAATSATNAAASATAASGSAIEAAETVADTNARFDNALAAVTTDTELADIRVGSDGVTYGSAGSAVRSQVSDLRSNFINLLNKRAVTAGNSNTTVAETQTGIRVYNTNAGAYSRGAIEVSLNANTDYILSFDAIKNTSNAWICAGYAVRNQDGTYPSSNTNAVKTKTDGIHFAALRFNANVYVRFVFYATLGDAAVADVTYNDLMLYEGDKFLDAFVPYSCADDAYLRSKLTNRFNVLSDSMGSVFPNVEDMVLNERENLKRPEYIYRFGDYVAGATISGNFYRNAYTTKNHPILINETSVIIAKNISELLSSDDKLYMEFGIVTNSGFVSQHIREIDCDDGTIVNLVAYADEITSGETYVVFDVLCVNNYVDLNDMITLKCINRASKFTLVNFVWLPRQNISTQFVLSDDEYPKILYYQRPHTVPPTDYSKLMRINPGWRYIYCAGLPFAAVFYNRKNEIISGSYSNFGDFSATKSYCTSIEIPESAAKFALCIQAPRSLTYDYKLSHVILNAMPLIGAMADVGKEHTKTTSIANAVHNANTLLNFKCKCEQLPLRTVFLGGPMLGYVKGFPYGRRTPNIYESFYTYARMIEQAHGYTLIANRPPSYNSYFGFVCTSFISTVLCLPFFESVEWLLQNYSDQLEELTETTKCDVGDLILSVHYYYSYNSTLQKYRPATHTHIQLITDVIYDKDGIFSGYKVAEATGGWTRSLTFQSDDPGIMSDSPDGHIKRVWRLPIPMKVPRIEDSYRFPIDAQYDVLNNFDATPKPSVLSYLSSVCLIGPRPADTSDYKYDQSPSSTVMWFENPPDGTPFTATLTKPDGTTESLDIDELATSRGTNLTQVVMRDYLTDTGVYKVNCDWCDAAREATFYRPEYPTNVTLTKGESGKVIKVEFDSGFIIEDTSQSQASIHTTSFDEIWARVIPYPKVLPGLPNGAPYSNYMYVNASELWDGEGISVGDRYNYICALTFVNNTYGSVEMFFCQDHAPELVDPDDYDDDIFIE